MSADPGLRQQVMILYLDSSALDSEVCAWTFYDGTGRTTHTTGESDEPPYATGLAALVDGWRLLQISPITPPVNGHEHEVSVLRHEFVFERIVDL
nr:hypothetical protein [Desertimonas flava]